MLFTIIWICYNKYVSAICSSMDGPRDYHTKWSNMDGPRNDHTKWSKSDRERQISCDIMYMWNLKKWYKWTYLQNRNRLADIENKLMGYMR